MELSNTRWRGFQGFLLELYRQSRLNEIQKMVMEYLQAEILHQCSMFDYGRAGDETIRFFHPYSGNLDEQTAEGIIELLKQAAHELGKCVIVVTHSKYLANESDEIVQIANGIIEEIIQPR